MIGNVVGQIDFPSFWEGLSLRQSGNRGRADLMPHFPSFWEGLSLRQSGNRGRADLMPHFPSFWEGLSLRLEILAKTKDGLGISLPFGKGFH